MPKTEQTTTTAKNKITEYLFAGTLTRSEFLARIFSIYFIATMSNIILFKYFSGAMPVFVFLFICACCALASLSVVIRRANSFTSVPWFFGVASLAADTYNITAEILKRAYSNTDMISDYMAYFYAPWLIALLILLFTPSKETPAESKNNGLCT